MHFLNNNRHLSQRSFRRHLFAVILHQKETMSGLIFFPQPPNWISNIIMLNMGDFPGNPSVRLWGKDFALFFYALFIEAFLLGSVLKDWYPGLLKKIVFLIDGNAGKEKLPSFLWFRYALRISWRPMIIPSATPVFTITVEILARSLANLYRQ